MATPAEIWAYAAAGDSLAGTSERVDELHLIHGLRAGSPLEVTDSSRSAGAVLQSLVEAAGTVTVTRQ